MFLRNFLPSQGVEVRSPQRRGRSLPHFKYDVQIKMSNYIIFIILHVIVLRFKLRTNEKGNDIIY